MTKTQSFLSAMVADTVRTLTIDEQFPTLIARTRGDFPSAWDEAETDSAGMTALVDILVELVQLAADKPASETAYILETASALRGAFFEGITLTDNGPGKVSSYGFGLLALVVQLGRIKTGDHPVANIQMAGLVLRHVPKDTQKTALPFLLKRTAT